LRYLNWSILGTSAPLEREPAAMVRLRTERWHPAGHRSLVCFLSCFFLGAPFFWAAGLEDVLVYVQRLGYHSWWVASITWEDHGCCLHIISQCQY
jgi:hypothetical protein